LAPTIAERPALRPQADKTLWTCPMHQQIVCDARLCPICGMALEPMRPTMRPKTPNCSIWMRRFLDQFFCCSAPLLANGDDRASRQDALDALIPPHMTVWLQLTLSTPAVLWGGWPFFVRGWASVRARHLTCSA